jgi:hypothetical protein
MDDAELMGRFTGRTLTHAEWTHEAHLRIAWMFVRDQPLDEAHCLFRIALIKLNDAHGVPESPTRGYHETITRAWLAVVGAAARRDRAADSREFLGQHPELLRKDCLARHYTAARLMSVEARARFVDPDLEALPSGE